MPLSPGFSDYVLELLTGFGRVQAKRMFGGAGLFRDGVMFGLLLNDVVYFRVDEALAVDLKEQGSAPWVYTRNGKPREMSYWRMPETAADDPDEAVAIARRAYAAAIARKAESASPRPRRQPAGKRPAPARAKVKAKAGK
jgi:DNA transformation protein